MVQPGSGSGKVPITVGSVAAASVGYLGFLVGPPVVGSVSGVLGLRMALALFVVAGVVMFFAARTVMAGTAYQPALKKLSLCFNRLQRKSVGGSSWPSRLRKRDKDVAQGLKPRSLLSLYGPTKVVP
jgi:MFS family permease